MIKDMNIREESRFLAYSCSGCSSAAQMANYLAVQLDRQGICEMSCIAGVGGDVKALVNLASSGRPILAIDGCALQCARACLERHNLSLDRHIILSQKGVKKQMGADFNADQARQILAELIVEMEDRKSAGDPDAA
jgi:uncharacterized metal-binding protein